MVYGQLFVLMVSGLIELFQVFRYNTLIGVSDFVMICLGYQGLFYAFEQAFVSIPMWVIFQRLIPEHVEVTMMAFATSFYEFTSGIISNMMGVLINKYFVGVDEDNLSDYYKLVLIQICCSLVLIFMAKLIPNRQELEDCIKQQAEAFKKNKTHSPDVNT